MTLMTRLGRVSALAAAVGLAFAGPAAAQICDMQVFDSVKGKPIGRSDSVYNKDAQFIVCFQVMADGYVSLWDRMPTDGEIERLAPSPKFETGDPAVPVRAGERRCFGDGSAGYYYLMEARDGDGLGRMWLVFSERIDTHPDEESFDSSNEFASAYKRFGAGSIAADIEKPSAAEIDEPGVCTPRKTLNYDYRVLR